MSTSSFLAELWQRGVVLKLSDDGSRILVRRKQVSPELRARLAQDKPEILKLLAYVDEYRALIRNAFAIMVQSEATHSGLRSSPTTRRGSPTRWAPRSPRPFATGRPASGCARPGSVRSAARIGPATCARRWTRAADGSRGAACLERPELLVRRQRRHPPLHRRAYLALGAHQRLAALQHLHGHARPTARRSGPPRCRWRRGPASRQVAPHQSCREINAGWRHARGACRGGSAGGEGVAGQPHVRGQGLDGVGQRLTEPAHLSITFVIVAVFRDRGRVMKRRVQALRARLTCFASRSLIRDW